MSTPREVRIKDDGIRLGQFLKLIDAVEAGSDVKDMLMAGAVTVNGLPDDRRGRQLARGDVISVDNVSYKLT